MIRSLKGVPRNVLVLGLSSSFATFANTIWLFFFPLLLEGYGVSVAQVGTVYALNLLSAAALQVPAGAFADRYGRKTAVVLGSSTAAAATFFLSLSQSALWSSIAFIAFASIGGAFFSVGRSALITESVPKEKLATSFGTFTTMAGWLSMFAPALGGLYVAHQARLILLSSSALYASVATARALFLKETLVRAPVPGLDRVSARERQSSRFKTLFSNLGAVFSNRILLALTLAYTVYGVLFDQTSFVVTVYSKYSLHLTDFQVGLMYSIFLLVDSQLAILFGRWADRFDKRKIIVVSWLGEMVLMMVFIFSTGPLFSLLAFGAWTAFGGLDGPAISALVGIVTKAQTRGLSYGFFGTFSLLLSVPAPILAGLLYSAGPKLPFFALLGVDAVALVFFLRFTVLREEK